MSAFIGTPTDDYTASFDDPSISDQSVSIGPILLDGWEIPEKVTWGGAQRMTVHKYVGGTRDIDVLGPDNSEVSWSGRFLSYDAAFRADQLDLLRKSGALVDVVFAGRYYSAVISQFTAEQVFQFNIQYHISLTILADESSVQPPPELPAIVLVTNDIATIVATAIVAPQLLAAQAAAARVPPLIAPLGALQTGSAATTAVLSGIVIASSLANTAQRIADGNISAMAATSLVVGNLAGAATVVGAVAAMNAARSETFAMASSVSMGAYINRAGINVGLQAGVGARPGVSVGIAI